MDDQKARHEQQSASAEPDGRSWVTAGRVLIISLVGIIIVLGLILIAQTVGEAPGIAGERERANALAESDNECVECHRNATPGIVRQLGFSTMAAAEVTCQDCHEVDEEYPASVEHEGTWVLASPTTAMCEPCHEQEVAQFNASRHGIPAYAALVGLEGLSDEHLEVYEAIPEAQPNPNETRNALYALEGEAITRFACHGCHDIGKPADDGSIGRCEKCHLRHEFSLEQARKPETCNYCHIGPDHPQWEIYTESPHGIAYATGGHRWHWEAEAGTVSVEDFPAPTCALCHMSGFGASGTTHDVGSRLTWYLFAPVSERRPNWEDNLVAMQNVCLNCHNEEFVADLYESADELVTAVNERIETSNETIQPLRDEGLLTPEPFDEPIDFVHFNLWHHWGRTAKFGAWMQGPDYTQWHGAYEILHDQAELEKMVEEKLEEAEGAAEAEAPAAGTGNGG